MVFVNVGTLGALPGKRDELVSLLTARNQGLSGIGCLLYEVGVNEEEPDSVFVAELWSSAASHQASLGLPAVQAVIAAAQPLLSGAGSGFKFDSLGSPLRG